MLHVDHTIGHHHDLGVRRSDSRIAEPEGTTSGTHDEATDSQRHLLGLSTGGFDDHDWRWVEHDLIEVDSKPRTLRGLGIIEGGQTLAGGASRANQQLAQGRQARRRIRLVVQQRWALPHGRGLLDINTVVPRGLFHRCAGLDRLFLFFFVVSDGGLGSGLAGEVGEAERDGTEVKFITVAQSRPVHRLPAQQDTAFTRQVGRFQVAPVDHHHLQVTRCNGRVL